MRRILAATAVALLGLFVSTGHAQVKLKTDGFGTLSGTVTLDGAIPAIENLVPKMKANPDAQCCLDPKAKAIEKIDATWVVDPKTKAVANVMVWVKAPKDTYLEVHPKLKVRKEKIEFDQPHCAFLPRIAAYNPVYYDGAKMVKTGQELIIKNSAVVGHNVRVTGHPKYNEGFNRNMPAKTELNVTKDPKLEINPQHLPLSVQCDIHTWMAAKLFVFDHPYYALTNAKGEFEIPNVPAGAEVSIMAWHEGVGWVLTNQGKAITIKKGEKHTMDIKLKPPAPQNGN